MIVRPLSDRSRFTGKHVRSQFDSTWTSTGRLLFTEVKHLHGRDLVLELDVREGDIRLDGWIRANARPATPGVRVAFESVHGPLTYATDRFTTWQDNVRAIALGLEALRKVDRYGITKSGEQYAGWKQLPSGSGSTASHMTADQALQILADLATSRGPGTCYPADISDAIQRGQWHQYRRRIIAAAHPDSNDGDQTLWDQYEQAARVVGVTP